MSNPCISLEEWRWCGVCVCEFVRVRAQKCMCVCVGAGSTDSYLFGICVIDPNRCGSVLGLSWAVVGQFAWSQPPSIDKRISETSPSKGK